MFQQWGSEWDKGGPVRVRACHRVRVYESCARPLVRLMTALVCFGVSVSMMLEWGSMCRVCVQVLMAMLLNAHTYYMIDRRGEDGRVQYAIWVRYRMQRHVHVQ